MTTLGSGQIAFSQVNSVEGIGNSNTSLQYADKYGMGDTGGSGTANINNSRICMPNEILNEVTGALAKNVAGWTYTGTQAGEDAWAPHRLSEFHGAYTGKPTISLSVVGTGVVNHCVLTINVGGEYAGSMTYYYNLNSGGWTGVNGTTSLNEGNGTFTAYVRDPYNCGSNYEVSSSVTYP